MCKNYTFVPPVNIGAVWCTSYLSHTTCYRMSSFHLLDGDLQPYKIINSTREHLIWHVHCIGYWRDFFLLWPSSVT